MADGGVAQTSAYLRMLLLRPGEYRSRWERWTAGPNPCGIDVNAVSDVLAQVRPVPPDTVRAALDGTAVDDELVGVFATAFGFDGRDAARLRELHRGTDTVRVISGGAAVSVPDRSAPDGSAPRRHDTLALHELHVLGPDGAPAEHQTIQVIRALADGLDRYPYRFDTDELAVEVIRGGRVGDRIYRLADTLYAVDIVLDRPLDAGQTALTQVRTTFHYRTPPVPEFRRGVIRRTEDLTIWVKFHPDRVPARVWLSRWDGIDDARIVERKPVELDDDLAVHDRFGPIEQAVVGFTWEWD